MILTYATGFAMGCFALSVLLNLIQVARAPSIVDRVLAVDTMTVNIIALLMLYGLQAGTAIMFEPALLLAMTGFVATVAYAKYLLRGSIIE